MGPWIAIIYLCGNNGEAMQVSDDPDGQFATRFNSVEDIERLKTQHLTHAFPWIAVNVETGDTEYLI